MGLNLKDAISRLMLPAAETDQQEDGRTQTPPCGPADHAPSAGPRTKANLGGSNERRDCPSGQGERGQQPGGLDAKG